jgi:hypothetical protein
MNIHSWEWRAVLAHNIRDKNIDCILLVLQYFYCSTNETVFESQKKFDNMIDIETIL